MTRVYRDRPGFVRPYWMLAGLCGFGCLLSALTLFPASSGLTAVVGSLALLASGASAAAMLMILLRFRLLPLCRDAGSLNRSQRGAGADKRRSGSAR